MKYEEGSKQFTVRKEIAGQNKAQTQHKIIWRRAVFQRRNFIWSKTLFSQETFDLLQVLAIGPRILLKCRQQSSNAFPEKYFVYYNSIIS